MAVGEGIVGEARTGTWEFDFENILIDDMLRLIELLNNLPESLLEQVKVLPPMLCQIIAKWPFVPDPTKVESYGRIKVKQWKEIFIALNKEFGERFQRDERAELSGGERVATPEGTGDGLAAAEGASLLGTEDRAG